MLGMRRTERCGQLLSRLAAAVLSAAVLLVVSAPGVSAQQLRGTVTEVGSDTPLEGAVVTVVGGEDALRAATISDASGDFTLLAPPGDTVRLHVQRLGYTGLTT